jgi:DNA-binding ferritin-like protein
VIKINFFHRIIDSFNLKEDIKREEKDLLKAEKSVEDVENDFNAIMEDIRKDMQDLNREEELDNFFNLTNIEQRELCARMKRFLPVISDRIPNEISYWHQLTRLINSEVGFWETAGLKAELHKERKDIEAEIEQIRRIIEKEESLLSAAGKDAANKKATAEEVEKFLQEIGKQSL